MRFLGLLAGTLLASASGAVAAEKASGSDAAKDALAESASAMTIDRIESIVRRIDSKAEREANSVRFKLSEREMLLVADPNADRMRVMTPIARLADLPAELPQRLLQANFDSALDARYAIANELVWGVFVHPLTSLTEADLLSGIGQTANVAQSFGTSYSSGAFVYGGGDSQALQLRELLDTLKALQDEQQKKRI